MHDFCLSLNWSGLKPEVWAAWVQAILSAIAIFYAGWFGLRQHRRDLYQRVRVLTRTVEMANAVTWMNGAALKKASALGQIFFTDTDYFLYLTKALEGAPLHELPDERLVHVMAGSARKSIEILKMLEQALSNGNISMPPSIALSDSYHEAEKALHAFARQATEVELDYERKLVLFPMMGYWKWRRKKSKFLNNPMPVVTLN